MIYHEHWQEDVSRSALVKPLGFHKSFLVVMAMTLGFSTASLVIRLFVQHNPMALYASGRSEKLAILDKMNIRDITTIAFGSSHVHDGFLPPAWDRSLGLPGFAFNDAVQGGSLTEQRSMAFDFLARPSANPCLVLAELNAGLNFGPDKLQHPRAINVYDAGMVRFVLGYGGSTGMRALGRKVYALAAGIENFANLGMVSGYLMRDYSDPQLVEEETIKDRRGFTPTHVAERTLQQADDILARLPSEQAAAPREMSLPPGALTFAHELLLRSPRTTQLVYLQMPLVEELSSPVRLPSEVEVDGRNVPVINTMDLHAFPMLRESWVWADVGHLSEAGARAFTATLAEQVGARIDIGAYNRCEAEHAVH